MDNQTVQPVQQANQAVQPSLPAPQQPGFMQSDPADISFAIDEASGSLIMVPKGQSLQTQQQLVSDQNATPTEDIRFQTGRDEAATNTIQEPNPLADRIDKMEGMMQQLGMLLQGMMSGQNLSNLNQQQPQADQEENIDLNELDGVGLVRLIKTAVDSALKQQLSPIQQNQSEIIMRQQFNDAAYKYGQQFIDLTPAMVELKKSDPNISWDQAYAALKMGVDIASKKKSTTSDSTIQTGNGSGRQPQPAQTLINRANQLVTETNGTPRVVVDQTQRISTVDQAFAKAWNDLGM